MINKDKTGDAFKIDDEFGSCFAVHPIRDCPHTKKEHSDNLLAFLKESLELLKENPEEKNVFSLLKCKKCVDLNKLERASEENWICLTSKQINCSRYVESHAADHNVETQHPLAFSFSDASFWCYSCDSYVTSKRLDRLRKVFGHIKHRKTPQTGRLGDDDDLDDLIDAFKQLNIKEDTEVGFSFDELVQGFKDNSYKKVTFITGAGISVAAGIPDFRSKGGLYETLGKKYGKSEPEQMMALDFFLEHPECLYSIMREFFKADVKSNQPNISYRSNLQRLTSSSS